MDEKKETDFLNNGLKNKKRNQLNIFFKTTKGLFDYLVGSKTREKERAGLKQQKTTNLMVKKTPASEKELLLEAKKEAEDLLALSYQQSEKMYQEVQKEIEYVKEEIELKKRQSFKQIDKEKLEAKKITQKAEQEADELISLANMKAEQLEEELSLKKATYQQEIDRELEKLVKEKDWFERYQEQVKETVERKEKSLFYESRKKIEQEQLEKAALQNKIDYLKVLNTKRKMNSYRIGLVIFGCTVVMSVLLSVFRYSTPILPFVIACLAFILVYINLVDGKNEREVKKISFQNASLIEKNKALEETIEDLEKDTKKLIEEKIELERTKRQSQDSIEFLKIMQADLKQSEIHRRILESENAALRKHLVEEINK